MKFIGCFTLLGKSIGAFNKVIQLFKHLSDQALREDEKAEETSIFVHLVSVALLWQSKAGSEKKARSEQLGIKVSKESLTQRLFWSLNSGNFLPNSLQSHTLAA